jgi:DNA-binding protein HU-beta
VPAIARFSDCKVWRLATKPVRLGLALTNLLRPGSAVKELLTSAGDQTQLCTQLKRRRIRAMSKAFVASVLQEAAELSGSAANATAGALIEAIVKQMKRDGKFTQPVFGTFKVAKTRARKGLNRRTGAAIKVKAGKTVRLKASPTLKKAV